MPRFSTAVEGDKIMTPETPIRLEDRPMSDCMKFSRRRVIATTVAVGCWGGVPGHAFPDQPSDQDPAPVPAAGPADGPKGPPQFDQNNRNQTAAAAWNPSEGPNKPMGEGKGIHPGRVVWVHNPDVAAWDGVTERNRVVSGTGQWWDDAYCNQDMCTEMMSSAVQNTAGEKSDKKAWEAIFKNFNETHGFASGAYKPGEKITIKVNFNNDRSNSRPWTPGRGYPVRNCCRRSCASWCRTPACLAKTSRCSTARRAGSSATRCTSGSWKTRTSGCTRFTSR